MPCSAKIRSLKKTACALPYRGKEVFMDGSPWTVYRTRFLVRARQLTEPLVFTDALGREQSGRPGDYLVEYSEGIKRITAKILFEDIYVPLSTVPPNEANSGIVDAALSRTSSEHDSSGHRLSFSCEGIGQRPEN
jgi:hypothetical protein